MRNPMLERIMRERRGREEYPYRGSGNESRGRDFYGDRRGDYNDYNDYNDYRDYRDYRDYHDPFSMYGNTYPRFNAKTLNPYENLDYNKGSKLKHEELREWQERLMGKMDEKDREMLKKEKIFQRAQELGIKFDYFNQEEFYTALLMIYKDFSKTLGTASLDTYLRLAKDWLCAETIPIQYGDKLAIFYDIAMMR